MRQTTTLTIGKRLAIGCCAILALSTCITAIALWRLHSLSAATQQMLQQPLAKERLVSDWNGYLRSGVRATSAIARSSDPSLVAFFAEDIRDTTRNSTRLQTAVGERMASAAEQQLFAQIGATRQKYVAARERISGLKADGRAEEAQRVFTTDFMPAAVEFQAQMSAMLALQRAAIDQHGASIERLGRQASQLLVGLQVLGLIVGIAGAWYLARRIVGPLEHALTLACQVAQGDLSAEIQVASDDETGRLLAALKEMIASLRHIAVEVRGGTDAITSAVDDIASGHLDLSSRTQAQAGALEAAAASLEELTGIARQNTVNAEAGSELALGAAATSSRAVAAVAEVVQTMDDIRSAAQKISDITGVIDGIAFQTNILALNAAVEAARAGEHGRGFAVVAAEVRTLAQRAAGAAREIHQLIAASTQHVDKGGVLVAHAGATMQEMVGGAGQVAAIMAGVLQASQEQHRGIDQVNRAILQLDQSTGQNAALVEQAAAATASMQAQAAQLAVLVRVFRTTPDAPAARPHGRALPSQPVAGWPSHPPRPMPR